MKLKNLLLLLFLSSLMMLLSCNEEDPQLEESKIELVSPEGYKIANSTSDLLQKIKPEILSSNMIFEDVTISKVQFEKYNDYNFATVEFSDNNGKSNNVILTNFNLGMGNKSCSDWDCYAVTCTGKECCIVHMIMVDGNPNFDCVCEGCQLNVRRFNCNNDPDHPGTGTGG